MDWDRDWNLDCLRRNPDRGELMSWFGFMGMAISFEVGESGSGSGILVSGV